MPRPVFKGKPHSHARRHKTNTTNISSGLILLEKDLSRNPDGDFNCPEQEQIVSEMPNFEGDSAAHALSVGGSSYWNSFLCLFDDGEAASTSLGKSDDELRRPIDATAEIDDKSGLLCGPTRHSVT